MSNSTSNGELIIPPGCVHSSECLKEYGQLHYIPNLAGNVIYLAIFILVILIQLGLGIKFRTWGYMTAMIGGCALEVVGYIGRLMLHNDIFNNNSFIIYLVGLTIGPAFYSAAIYLSLSRILAIYGPSLTFLKPRTITIIFIGCDFISLLLQAAGGAIASTADDQSGSDMGVNIMIAGLSTQVVATFAFGLVCLHLMYSIRKFPHKVNQESVAFRRGFKCRAFMWAIGITTLAILIRCAFRCAELSEGFNGQLANDEATFMILDGLMMIITVIVLTLAHPGITLGVDRWEDGAFRSKKKGSAAYTATDAKESLQNGSDTSMERMGV